MSDGEVLVVVSKLKAYIREKSGMNTSGNVAPALSDTIRRLCDEAIERAKKAGRKTIMDRDFMSEEP
jgi:histone H3/H4